MCEGEGMPDLQGQEGRSEMKEEEKREVLLPPVIPIYILALHWNPSGENTFLPPGLARAPRKRDFWLRFKRPSSSTSPNLALQRYRNLEDDKSIVCLSICQHYLLRLTRTSTMWILSLHRLLACT